MILVCRKEQQKYIRKTSRINLYRTRHIKSSLRCHETTDKRIARLFAYAARFMDILACKAAYGNLFAATGRYSRGIVTAHTCHDHQLFPFQDVTCPQHSSFGHRDLRHGHAAALVMKMIYDPENWQSLKRVAPFQPPESCSAQRCLPHLLEELALIRAPITRYTRRTPRLLRALTCPVTIHHYSSYSHYRRASRGDAS